jgi:O-antigen/teichoic acid export membrane protein
MNRKVGVIYSNILMLVEILSTMLFTPFLIRTLGQAEYGVYQLVTSITSYLVLLDLGVGNSVIRYMAKYRADKDEQAQKQFLGITTIYYLLIAVVALGISAVILALFPTVFAKGLSPEEVSLAEKLFGVTMCAVAIALATSAFSNTVIAYERFSVSKGTAIVLTVLKIFASVGALKLGFGSMGIVFVNFIITILTRSVYVVYVLFVLKIRPYFKKVRASYVKEIASFSSFILLQMIASQINAMSDQILLGIFAKGASVIIGIYGVGAQVLQYFKTIGSHFTSVLMPGLVRLVETGADAKRYEDEMIRISRIVFMVLSVIWVVFALFGRDFICLWAGAENEQAYYVAVLLMFPAIFSYSEGVGYQLLQSMAKHKLPAIVQVISAVLNVGLTIILIRWNPLKGAVIGTFIALVVCDIIIMNIMYKRQIGIRLTVYFAGLFKGIVPALLAAAAAGGLMKFAQLSRFGWLGFFVNCAVTALVYAVVMWLFGMNAYEKAMIRSPLQKVCKKLFK